MTQFILSGGTNAVGGKHTADIFDSLHAMHLKKVLIVPYALDGRSRWLAYLWRNPRRIVKDSRFELQTANWGDSQSRLDAQLAWADAIVLVGGNPGTLIKRLRERIPRLPENVQCLVGISAGSLIVGEWYAASRQGETILKPGLGWLPHTTVDVHVAQRQRQGRVQHASTELPEARCYGLDEYVTIRLDDHGVLKEKISGNPLLMQAGRVVRDS